MTIPEGFEEFRVAGQQETKSRGSSAFPFAIRPTAVSTPADATATGAFLSSDGRAQQLVELLRTHGAILVRGLPLSGAEGFLTFLEPFGFEYGTFSGGGGPRKSVLGPIHNSTFTPPHLHIPFHHELAYLPTGPAALGFFSETPAASGGETPVLHSGELLARLEASDPEFIASLRAKGVVYTRTIDDARAPADDASAALQRTWQAAMAPAARDTASCAEVRAEAERVARDTGAAEIVWEPYAEGADASDPEVPARMVVTSIVLPGTTTYAGVETFYNAVVLLHPAGQDSATTSVPWRVTYGDGSEIPDESVRRAKETMATLSAAVLWEKGDVMLVDNKLAMHSRNPFEPPRLTLAVIMSKI